MSVDSKENMFSFYMSLLYLCMIMMSSGVFLGGGSVKNRIRKKNTRSVLGFFAIKKPEH